MVVDEKHSRPFTKEPLVVHVGDLYNDTTTTNITASMAFVLFSFSFCSAQFKLHVTSRHLLSKFSIIFESDEAGKEEEEEEEEGEERIKSTKIQNVGVAP